MSKNRSDLHLKATHVTPKQITWAQLSLAASEDLRGLIGREPKAAQLILALIERMEPGGGGVVVASRTTMGELIGASVPTITRALRVLIDEGWVQRMRIGGAPALAINSRVAWVGSRGDLSHSVFAATVIASRSEQDEIALNPPPMRPIPTIRRGETPLPTDTGLEPPSQPDFPEVPPVVAYQAELEARGQLRLNVDPETGEIMPPQNPDPWAHLRGLTQEQIAALPPEQRQAKFPR